VYVFRDEDDELDCKRKTESAILLTISRQGPERTATLLATLAVSSAGVLAPVLPLVLVLELVVRLPILGPIVVPPLLFRDVRCGSGAGSPLSTTGGDADSGAT